MSTILEQYFAAARQRREHDAARVSDAEYIRTTPTWKCVCGNEPEAQGFFPVEESMKALMAAVEPCGEYIRALDLWECDRCKRVIVAPHGYVTRGPMTSVAIEGVRSDYEGVSRVPAPEDAPCLVCGAPESGCECEERDDVEPDSNRTLGLRNGD